MNLSELIKYYRDSSKDDKGPSDEFLFSNEYIQDVYNEAELEACWRRRLLIDSSFPVVGSSSEVDGDPSTRVEVIPNVWVYELDPKVLFVRRALWGSEQIPLNFVSHRDLDRSFHGWDKRIGDPTTVVTGLDSSWDRQTLRLTPIPDRSGFIYLTVVRAPLGMVNPTDSPEIAERWHRKLLNWVMYRVYNLAETETYNPELANSYLAMFEKDFGTRDQAIEEERDRQRATANRFDYADGTY